MKRASPDPSQNASTAPDPPFFINEGRRRGKRWGRYDVRALRSHLRLTQQEMARELGTRQQTISDWETGVYQPRGTSHTILNVIAERAGFVYQVGLRTIPEPSKVSATGS